jgi:hypothetical protein
MSRHSSAIHSPGPSPVGGEEHHRPGNLAEPAGDVCELRPRLERPLLRAPPLWVVDTLLGWVDLDQPPGDRAGEHLS